MNFKNALINMNALQKTVMLLGASNLLMAGGLAYGFVSASSMHERIVLIPPHLDNRAEVAWNSASKEYIKSFGMYVATLVGNIQPRTSTVVLDAVSSFMDPAIYVDFRRQVASIIEDPSFKQAGAVMIFQPSTVQFEPETSRVFVTGSLITKSSGQDRQKSVTYEMGVRIRDGQPWVDHFTSYEGSIIHGVSWHINNSSREGVPIPQHAIPVHMRDKAMDASAADQSVLSQPQSEGSQ